MIRKLNENILIQLGGKWDEPPVLHQGWKNAAALDDFKDKARSIIRKDFAAAKVWGWKDPRTCLTLPFWREILPSMRYVICLRDPIEMSHSMRRFHNCYLEHGLYLWLVYMRSALEHTKNDERIFVSFKDLIVKSEPVIEDLSKLIETPVEVGMGAKTTASNFIDSDLWHYRASKISELTSDECSPVVLDAVQRTYDSLRNKELVGSHALSEVFHDALTVVSPIAEEKLTLRRRIEHEQWTKKERTTSKELNSVIGHGDKVIMVDDNSLKLDESLDGIAAPFLERNGKFWGQPRDDATAISELERMRRSGADFLVVAWPAFWWFDYYAEFHRYLRSSFRCILDNDRVVVFDLQQRAETEGSSKVSLLN